MGGCMFKYGVHGRRLVWAGGGGCDFQEGKD